MKQYMVISLLVIYQLVSFLHITYLPKVSYPDFKPPSSVSVLSSFHKSQHLGAVRIIFQKSINSFGKNKRKSLSMPAKLLVPIFSFFLCGLIALSITKRHKGYAYLSNLPVPAYYLSLRQLRI